MLFEVRLLRINHFVPDPRFERFLCYPESFGHYANETEHYENRPNGLTTYNWHIVRAGKGYVRIGEKTVELNSGTGFLYGPGVPQQYYADSFEPWDIRWIHFTARGLGTLLQGRGDREPWLFSWEGVERLDQLWSELLDFRMPPMQEGAARLSAITYEMIALIVQHAETIEGNPKPGMRDRLTVAAEWIRTHCHEPLTLEQMSSQASCSPSHFSRQFHSLIGKTPIEYLTECRILQSKNLLVSTSMTIKNIAELVGFANSTYFIQRFRKSEGMTPEQFRILRGAGNNQQN
ncbi:AraC family transcriptional regulator [Paenibacillus glycanilyticus]|uniref:AraC family transcriptional regulator n=1 Tax=Paenibacillus glycanilyticus TaxID=126569 RepID=UPI003EBFC2A3